MSKKGQIGMPTKLKDKEKEIVSEIVRQINQGNINEARWIYEWWVKNSV